ncbi:hypothetical protein V8C86DRAFT_2682524 [Haematococcus lacustris]
MRQEGGTSRFKGVTRHRHTLKYEAHLWDSSVPRKTKGKRGRTRGKQVYLGSFATDEEAARAYDRAALTFWGDSAQLNFDVNDYAHEREILDTMDREECVNMLRRGSSGFARGTSRYRGVTRHMIQNAWEAKIERVEGKRCVYLGKFALEREAAVAYDRAAFEYRKTNKSVPITNFPPSRYFDAAGKLLPLEQLLHVSALWPEASHPEPLMRIRPHPGSDISGEEHAPSAGLCQPRLFAGGASHTAGGGHFGSAVGNFCPSLVSFPGAQNLSPDSHNLTGGAATPVDAAGWGWEHAPRPRPELAGDTLVCSLATAAAGPRSAGVSNGAEEEGAQGGPELNAARARPRARPRKSAV